jgi:hypothetical protein
LIELKAVGEAMLTSWLQALRGALSIWLFGLVLVGHVQAQEASDPRLQALRPGVAQLIRQAQSTLSQAKAPAQTQLAAREALRQLLAETQFAPLSANEAFWLSRLQVQILQGLGTARNADEQNLLRDALRAALQTRQATPKEQIALAEALVPILYSEKSYADLEPVAKDYVSAGGSQSTVPLMWGHALFLQKKYEAAVDVLQKLLTQQNKLKEKPQEIQLKILANAHRQLKNNAAYLAALEELLLYYPSPAYWTDRLNALESRPDFDDALRIDLLRFRLALRVELDVDELQDLVQLSLKAGYPVEAQQVLLKPQYSAAWSSMTPEQTKKWQPVKQQALSLAASEQAQFAALASEYQRQWNEKKISATALFNSAYGLWLLQPDAKQLNALAQAHQHLSQQLAANPAAVKAYSLASLRLGVAYWLQQQADKANALWQANPTSGPSPWAAGTGIDDLARLWVLAAQTGSLNAPK